MKTHQEYLEELKRFGEQVVSSNKVQSSGTKGTLGGLKSYFENYQEGIKKVSDQIIEKANSFLDESDDNPEIDENKLKQDLTEICQNLTQKFINKTNREFKS